LPLAARIDHSSEDACRDAIDGATLLPADTSEGLVWRLLDPRWDPGPALLSHDGGIVGTPPQCELTE
jgi:hypothetical protein